VTTSIESGVDAPTTADIHRHFRGLITSGLLGAGERLPTVRQTAADLGVSQGTAAKAYRLLEQEGLVTTRTAAGTRVSPSAAVLPQSTLRLIRTLAAEAIANGERVDDVIDVMRAVWMAQAP
jgi:DNA-binding transcriptional regulator YhcF (GntR family)